MEVMQKPQRNKAKKKKQREETQEEEYPETEAIIPPQQTQQNIQQNEHPEVQTRIHNEEVSPDSFGSLHSLVGEKELEEADREITSIYPSLAPQTITPLPQTRTPPPQTVTPPQTLTPPTQTTTPPPQTLTPPPQTTTPPPQMRSQKLTSLQKPPTPSYFSSLSDQSLFASSSYAPPSSSYLSPSSSYVPSSSYIPPSLAQIQPPTTAISPLSSSVPTFKIAAQPKMEAPTYNYATTTGYSTMYKIPAFANPVTVTEPTYAGLYTAQQTQTQQIEIEKAAVEEISFFHPLKQESEFFNMLKRYYATQKELDAMEPHTQELRDRCQNAQVWKFVEHSRALEVLCRDNVRVAHTFAWKEGMMDQEVYMKLRRDLEELRSICGERLTEQLFESQMAKLTIEIFIDDFLWHSQFDDSFRVGLDDSAPQEPLFVSNYKGDFAKLEHMVDVLFCFAFCFHSTVFFPPNSRYLELFCDGVKKWLQKLAGVYLRVCSPKDEIRLLQHVLNCPGIGEWGSHVIYFSDEWNFKQAEHFYTMLTFFLSPAPVSPPSFLTDFGQEILLLEAEKIKQAITANNFVRPTGAPRLLLQEEDYTAVLEQFPFFSFYKYIFEIRDYYAPHETEQAFAIAQRIVDLLTTALDTFANFPHLAKILASSIARILRFADIYYLHRKENLREDVSNVEQHFSELFIKVVSIFVSKGVRNGIWQFLSDLPFSSLNQTSSLNVLSILVGRSPTAPSLSSKRQWDELIHTDKSILDTFAHTLVTYEGTEFLLHAVDAWGLNSQDEFALAAQEVVFLVGYVLPQTKGRFHKDAREMIVGLCNKVSGSISDNVIPLLNTHFSNIGKSLILFLLKGLPWHDFHPSSNDLIIIKNWLLRPMKSEEFLAANFILEHANWGLASHQKGVPWWDRSTDPHLFIYAAMQREFAFALIEVWESHTKKNQPSLFSSPKENIDTWCIHKLLRLNFYAPDSEPYLEPLQISDIRISNMRKFYDDTSHVVPPVIAYTLIMTVGLTFKGLTILKGMAAAQQPSLLIRIFHDVVPNLITQNDPIIHEIAPFVEIVSELFKTPSSFFGEKTPKVSQSAVQFAAMVIVQILVHAPDPSRNLTGELGLGIAKFWVSVVTAVPQWLQNENCRYVLNRILATTFYHKIPLQFVDFLSQGKTSSFWKSSNTIRPSAFVEDYVWLAFEVLYAEAVIELRPNSTHAQKEPVSYEIARCVTVLQTENILAPIFLQLLFAVLFEEFNLKDQKMHPTKLFSHKSEIRKILLAHLDKLVNYHKSQQQIENYHDTNIANQNAAKNNLTNNNTTNRNSGNYNPTNHTSVNYNQANFNSTNYSSVNYNQANYNSNNNSANYTSTNYNSVNYNQANYNSNNNSTNYNSVNYKATNFSQDTAHKDNVKIEELSASSKSEGFVVVTNEILSVPHALLARIYYFMVSAWLAPNAPQEMAMFKSQPHLINNIPDPEAVKRIRSILMESPIYVRFSLWVDLLDMRHIYLTFLRNLYVSNFAHQYPDSFGNEETSPKLIPKAKARQIDLLDAFKNAPPALIIRPLVAPISLQNRELESTLKTTISSTGSIAHKYLDRIGLHATLDKHYLDLLPALYTSHPQTLQSDKACSARCTGMANFSIPASPAVMDERILGAIRQNREQILPYIENPEISAELCANIIFLHCMGKKFFAYFETHPKDSPEKTKLVDVIVEVFFHLVETCDDRAMLTFPPAKSSLRPLIKDLAESLRNLYTPFSTRFLGCIIANAERVMWMHPFWVPAFSNFDELCELATKHFLRVPLVDTERLVMPILSKFDFIQWLQVGPTTAQVRKVITILGTAIAAQNGTKFGPQLTQNPGWIFLHNAFKISCGHKLFEAYIDILEMLLNGSRTMTIAPEVWWGFLELPLSTTLSDTQIMATFEVFTKFFWGLRAPKQGQAVNLYTAFSPYIPPFVEFTKKLLGSHFTSSNPLFVGNGIMEVYEPWLTRTDSAFPDLPPALSEIFPWVPPQAGEAHLVVTGLVDCLTVLVDIYPQTFDNFVGFFLSKMAPYKTPEILSLPWYKWFISPNSLLLLLHAIQAAPPQILIEGQGIPIGLTFLLCEIIATVDWGIAISRAENQMEFAVNFLRLIIYSVYQHANPFEAKFGLFVKQIHTFNWMVLTSESYEKIISDFLGIVQKHHSSLQNFSASKGPHNRAIEIQKWGFLLYLLRCVAYVDMKTQDPHQILSISEKFCGFVQVIVYLLGLPNFDYWKGNDPFVALRDIMGIMKIRFKLLVQIPEGAACISKTIRTFLAINNLPVANERLRDSTTVSCEMLREVPYLSIEFLRAAHQTIFSVTSLALLVEHSLEVYFGLFIPPGPPIDALSVPELENKEFVTECTKKGHTYTLYIYCLQQLTRHAPLKTLCSNVWEWECNIPVETLGEKCYKMLPLWAKSASLIYYLFRETGDTKLIEQVNTLGLKIYKFGEDKKTDGFFGAIGFGGRSNFPPGFRFIAKALGTFLILQAHPADNTLAFRAAHQPMRAFAHFHKSHPFLERAHAFVTAGAARDKEYAAAQGIAQGVACAARFMDGAKTIENVEEFVGLMGEVMYPNAKIFVHMRGG